MKPCSLQERLALFGSRKSLTAEQALSAGATISDICWVVGRLGRKDLLVRFALACAQRTAHLNSDPRVQKALDAAQAWLDDPRDSTTYAADAAEYAAKTAFAAAFAAAKAADRHSELREQRRLAAEIFA
jgi:hypothetical protein